MADIGLVSWNESKGANVCSTCGHLSYGRYTGDYQECLECKKVHLMETQNEILREQHQAHSPTYSDSAELSPLKAALILSIVRLLTVFLIWNWLLPKKAESAAMLLTVGTVLAIDKLLPDFSQFTVLSSKERIVHWLLLIGSAWDLVRKLF